MYISVWFLLAEDAEDAGFYEVLLFTKKSYFGLIDRYVEVQMEKN